MYIIYKLTVNIDGNSKGKIYIGQSKNTLEKRWYYHVSNAFDEKYNGYDLPLARAIRKYGKDGFDKEIIEYNILTVDEANIAEKKWIKDLNAQNQEIGYNVSDGGYNYTRTEETKEKIRQARFNQPDPRLGTKHSDESKAKMSKAKMGKILGPHSKEHAEKIRQANLGKVRDRNAVNNILINRKKNKKSTSKYIGVYYKKEINKWLSSLSILGKRIYFGSFPTELEAAQVREKYIIDNSINAVLNFKE